MSLRDKLARTGITQNDHNVQDYVAGQKALKTGDLNAATKGNPRLEAAAKKLPESVKTELDERIKRGTI